MNKLSTLLSSLLLSLIFAATITHAEEPAVAPKTLPAGQNMYVIERDMPNLGNLTGGELKTASQTSCGVLKNLGPDITWLYSYVTADKMYCVYVAPNEAIVREHARLGGFPANAVNRVSTIISPKTAE